ncbi:MAG TPA: DMT family transporter [Burkholderiales bacterium]|nr:DMT family transporter [Burkholderiales bacterium]
MPVNPVYLLVATSAFFWGANFVLAAPVLADLPPLWAAALRFVLGGAVMLSLALRQGDELFSLARRHAGVYLLLGLVGIAAFNLLFFRAMETTSADNGALIMATNPLLTTLLAAAFLGERASVRQMFVLPLALAGVAVVISHGKLSGIAGFKVAEGDLLMLGANLTWAFFNVFSRRYMPQGSPTANTALMMTAGAGILLAAAVTSGSHLSMPGIRAILALSVMAIGGTVMAYLFWGIGIRQLGAGKTSLFLNLVPVFAMLVGGVTGSLPTTSQAFGGLIVLASVTMAMMPRLGGARSASPRS